MATYRQRHEAAIKAEMQRRVERVQAEAERLRYEDLDELRRDVEADEYLHRELQERILPHSPEFASHMKEHAERAEAARLRAADRGAALSKYCRSLTREETEALRAKVQEAAFSENPTGSAERVLLGQLARIDPRGFADAQLAGLISDREMDDVLFARGPEVEVEVEEPEPEEVPLEELEATLDRHVTAVLGRRESRSRRGR